MSSQTAAQRMDALEANMAAILAAVQGNATSTDEAKPAAKPASRKAVQAKAQAKVAATTRKAKAAGTHKVLPAGQAHPAREEDIGGIVWRFMPRNVNGIRVAPLNVGGKTTAKSLTREHLTILAEFADEFAAIVDEEEEAAGIGDYAPESADTDEEA